MRHSPPGVGKAWWGDCRPTPPTTLGCQTLISAQWGMQGCVKDSDVIVRAKRMNLTARLGRAKLWEGHTGKMQVVNSNY